MRKTVLEVLKMARARRARDVFKTEGTEVELYCKTIIFDCNQNRLSQCAKERHSAPPPKKTHKKPVQNGGHFLQKRRNKFVSKSRRWFEISLIFNYFCFQVCLWEEVNMGEICTFFFFFSPIELFSYERELASFALLYL